MPFEYSNFVLSLSDPSAYAHVFLLTIRSSKPINNVTRLQRIDAFYDADSNARPLIGKG